MTARTILLAGAVTFCSIVASSPCAQAQTAKAASPVPVLKDGWEEIDKRLIFLMVRLANVEASLDAVEAVISKTSGKRSARVADAKRAEKGNELMDRKGGGPMRWPEFYGRTAEKFFYHPVDASTTYHTVTVLSQQSPQTDNQTADGVPARQGLPVHQRPPQFDYIYRANRDAKARAEREATELSNKVEALLARRASLEAEQTALWCEIAFRAVSRHDLARKPLYRFELASASSTTIDRERAEAMKAAANFVRAAMAVIADAQRDQAKAFGSVKQDVVDARETLGDAWIRPTFLAAESTDVKAPAGKFAALAKRLENVASNLSDSYTVAIDADRFKDEQRKDVFRSLLQSSLVSYAQIVLALDEMAGALAVEWKLKPDVGKPLIAASRPRAVPAPSPATNLPSYSSTLPRSSLVLYHQFEELVASGEKESRLTSYGSNQDASTAKNCTLATGQFGRAVVMNGKDSYIVTKVPWRSAATVSLWVRVRDASQPYYLLAECDGSGAFSVQRWDDSPQLFTISLHARGQWESRTVSHGLSENKWHHVAVVQKGSIDEVRYFADGAFVGKVELPLRNGTWDGHIMISTPYLEKALPGDIDDFAVFNQPLEESQIKQIFTAGERGMNLGTILGLGNDQ